MAKPWVEVGIFISKQAVCWWELEVLRRGGFLRHSAPHNHKVSLVYRSRSTLHCEHQSCRMLKKYFLNCKQGPALFCKKEEEKIKHTSALFLLQQLHLPSSNFPSSTEWRIHLRLPLLHILHMLLLLLPLLLLPFSTFPYLSCPNNYASSYAMC